MYWGWHTVLYLSKGEMMAEYFKIIIGTVLITLILGILQFTYNQGYDSGMNAEKAANQKAYDEALAIKTKNYTEALNKVKRIAQDDLEAAISKAKEERKIETRTVKVIEYVNREIEVPGDCRDLVIDINRVFIDSTSNVTRPTTTTYTY